MNRPDLSVVSADAALHLSDDTLQGVVDGFLSAAEQEVAERHLGLCSECRRVRDVLLQTKETVGAGATLGRFRLLHEVGAGSIGRVFAAWDPVLNRRVAVKVLRVEATRSSRAQALLLREAQALARLTHPNVVAVHDAGTHHGNAWLAMEFVEGTTFGDWLRAAPRSTPEIARRFREACAGLAEAHRVGLLHRDLKLSNLMIGADGRLRVTDFGLAALAHEAEGHAPPTGTSAFDASLTETGALVGTPGYLSPEQWQGQPASSATDQFALGVALFEAVTGRKPFAGETVAQRLAAIREGPTWPAQPRVARALRAAIATATSFEPAKRYPSLEAMSRALEELDRRRALLRGAAIGAAVVVLVGPGAGVLYERQRSRCADLSQQLETTWGPAARARLAARAALHAPLDAWAQGWTQAREATCEAEARSSVPQRAQVSCLEEQRRLVAALVADISNDGAVTTGRALEAIAALPPPSVCAPRVAAASDDAVDQSQIRAALALHRLDDAERLVAKLELDARATERPRAKAAAALLSAELFSQRGRLADAEAGFRRAIADGERAHDDDVTAEAWVRLTSVVGVQLRRHQEALGLADLAAAVVDGRGRATERAELELTRAELLRLLGRLDEALAQAQLAQRALGEAFGPTHWRVAKALEAEAKVLQAQRKTEPSLSLLDRAERQALASLPPAHPVVVSVRTNRLVGLSNVRRHAEAEREARALLEVLRRDTPEAPQVGHVLVNLGRALRAQDKLVESIDTYREALRVKERLFGTDHIELAMVLNNLAGLHAALHDGAQALALHQRAYAIRVKALPADHDDVVMSLVNLGHSHQELGQCHEAIGRYAEALAIEERRHGATAPVLAEELTGLGECWLSLGRPSQALPLLERAVRLRESASIEDAGPEDVAQSRLALATALVALKRAPARAEELARLAEPALSVEQKAELVALRRRAGWPAPR